MSVEALSNLSISNNSLQTQFPPFVLDEIYLDTTPDIWIRNPSWLTLTDPLSTEQKFVGLFGVSPLSSANYVALRASGNYTVDWGDGVVENFSATSTASHYFDYSLSAFNNTDGPVTFVASTTAVSADNHSYTNGSTVTFYTINTTIGLSANVTYVVTNATTNTFQLTLSAGGDPIGFTNDGTGTLLPYKQAIVTVTPQSGQTVGEFFLNITPNQTITPVNAGASQNFLDLRISFPSMSAVGLGIIRTSGSSGNSGSNCTFLNLEQIKIINSNLTSYGSLCQSLRKLANIELYSQGIITNMGSCFQGCNNLRQLPFIDTSAATSFNFAFTECVKIKTVPNYDYSSNTSFQNCFYQCFSLIKVPFINAPKATSVGAIFQNCYNLKFISGINFSPAITSLQDAFSNCLSLSYLPYFNTSNVLSIQGFASACRSLVRVPTYDFSKCTNFQSAFSNCLSLIEIPYFNTSSGTNFSNFLDSCINLKKVPAFNTSNATNTSTMFRNCNVLTEVPTFDVSKVTNASSMYQVCYNLTFLPDHNFSTLLTNISTFAATCTKLVKVGNLGNLNNVTTAASMFDGCSSLEDLPSTFSFSSALTNTGDMFRNCLSLKTAPYFETRNVTSSFRMFSGCSSLEKIPSYNFSSNNNLGQMFIGCSNLKEFSTVSTLASATDFSTMFSGCTYLYTLPYFDTAKVIGMSNMLNNCSNLISIGAWNLSAISVAANMPSFAQNNSLTSLPIVGAKFSFSVANSRLDRAALNTLFSNLATVAVNSQIITITNCPGAATCDRTIATNKGWQVSG